MRFISHMLTSGSHDHNEENRNPSGAAGILTEEQKRVVDDGLSLRLTPTNIARMMERNGCGIPRGPNMRRKYMKAIQNRCIRNRRRARGGKSVNSWDSGDMAEFCEENKFDINKINENPDEMFVAENDCTN
jgi:hypothetical protein